MTFDLRIMKKDGALGVHAVYYEGDEAVICSIDPVKLEWDDDDENHIDWLIEKLQSAKNKPILNYDNF